MRIAKVQASLRIRAVSPEPTLFAEDQGRHVALLNRDRACALKD